MVFQIKKKEPEMKEQKYPIVTSKTREGKLFNEFMQTRFPKEPKNSYYTEEWRERFDRGNPQMSMDSQSLAVYNSLLIKHRLNLWK